jgi:hypothetical protein
MRHGRLKFEVYCWTDLRRLARHPDFSARTYP